MAFQSQLTKLSKLCSILNPQNMSIISEVTSRKFGFVLFWNPAGSGLISGTLKLQTQIRTSEESSQLSLQVFDKTYLLGIDRSSLHTEFCLASSLLVRPSSVIAKSVFPAVSRLAPRKVEQEASTTVIDLFRKTKIKIVSKAFWSSHSADMCWCEKPSDTYVKKIYATIVPCFFY